MLRSCMVHTAHWMCCFFVGQGQKVSLRFAAARAHLPRDVAEVAVHPVFHEFKQRSINFCAHFGYTHPHPFPTDGDAMGDPAPPPPDAVVGGAVLVPPPVQYPDLLLRQMLHLHTPWPLFRMMTQPPRVMHHHPTSPA